VEEDQTQVDVMERMSQSVMDGGWMCDRQRVDVTVNGRKRVDVRVDVTMFISKMTECSAYGYGLISNGNRNQEHGSEWVCSSQIMITPFRLVRMSSSSSIREIGFTLIHTEYTHS